MNTSLPRALEFVHVTDDYFHVKVDAHVFIYRVAPDRLSLVLSRVKHGGRRAYRSSGHYEKRAYDFALQGAAARGLIARTSEACEDSASA